MRDKIPIIFCIDSEPDEFDPGRNDAHAWADVEACFAELEPCRARLADSTGSPAAFTWMVRADPQLAEIYGDAAWGLRHYEATWRALLQRGDEVGLHPHPQRWSHEREAWVADQNRMEWPAQVLREAHAAYRSVLKRDPQSLRYGNRLMTQVIADAAVELGFRYDLTLEPGYAGRSGERPEHRVPGYCPDYHDIPRVPYRAVTGDYRSPASERRIGLEFIPMTTAPVADGPPLAGAPYFRPVAPRTNPYEVFHLRMSPAVFGRAVDYVLRELDRRYLAVVIRCDMIKLPEVWANLETLRMHALANRFVFATPAQAMDLLGTPNDEARRFA